MTFSSIEKCWDIEIFTIFGKNIALKDYLVNMSLIGSVVCEWEPILYYKYRGIFIDCGNSVRRREQWEPIAYAFNVYHVAYSAALFDNLVKN